MKIKNLFRLIGILFIVFILVACDFPGTSTAEKQHVKYVVDEEVVLEQDLTNGSTISKEDLAKYLPEHIGEYEWKKVEEYLEGDMRYLTYNLEYSLETFIVTFYDDKNKVIEIQEVEYGKSAVEPEMDERLNVTWDVDFSCITSFLDVHATITYKYCYINYYYNNTKLQIEDNIYVPGESRSLPTYEVEGYTFLGWYLSNLSYTKIDEIDENAYGDINLYAKLYRYDYSKMTLPAASLHFTQLTYNSDSHIWQPVMPVGDSVTSYNWTTSDSNVALVTDYSSLCGVNTGYCILTATNKVNPSQTINCILKVTADGFAIASEAELRQYTLNTVTFKGLNDEIIWEYQVRQGFNIFYPAAPAVEGYKFTGWDKDIVSISEDTVITAQYTEGVDQYAGKSFSLIGDSISTYYSYIPTGYRYFYPYATADMNSFNLTWWMQTIRALGGSLFINNSYSGSCVASGSTSDSQNPERLSKEIIQGETPDYLMIYMGNNDCAARFPEETFKEGYRKMVLYLLENCPDTKILLMTLPISGLYAEDMRTTYNNVIRQIAEQYNLDVIELGDLNLKPYLLDSAHPTIEGMTVIKNALVAYFNEK